MGSSEASTRRRVKLYMLNDERQWDDKGTGHVSALYTEQDSMALVVISETDGSYLLESKIQSDTAYQKQQETLIVWSEGENMDLALSFQEKVGCDDVWEKICAVQGKDPSVEITQEVIDESDDVDDADGYGTTLIQNIQPLNLPPCELMRLEETVDMISQAVVSPKRERLIVLLESTNYLNQLVDVFHKAEDLEDMESLHHLYEIMRQFILLNKPSLYENLFTDDMLMDVIGMLEYSPSGHSKHRDFLRNKASFKEVLPLHNPDLVSKIHQTYRVQYIQDCCLPPPCLFDEHTLSQLKAFVSINKLEIIRALQENDEFMRLLFTRLKMHDVDIGHRKDLALFIKEFCNISIQTDQKESFLNCLLQHGALGTAEVLLTIDDRDIKSAALEILQAFIEHQPSVVREFVYKDTAPNRKDEELLINLMINQLLNDPDPELSDAFLLGCMLRILIDPDNMNNSGARSEKTDFLSFFYKRCINTLVRPLLDNTVKDVLEKDDYHTALVLNHILELLTFCIETHTYHMKNFCFNRDLLKRVLVLLQSSHKFLVLAALRLFRRVVNMKEEFYNRYLVKTNLFKPVLKLFVSNGHRYNLVDSAIIELFDFIRSEEINFLITHIVENFWDILKGINYVQTFADLKRAFDQLHRPVRPTMVGGAVGQQNTLDVLSLASSRFQRDPRALEMEEEHWFDQDDEEEDEDESDHLFPHHHHQTTSTLLNGNGSTENSTISTESLGAITNGLSYSLHCVISTTPGIDSSSITNTSSSYVSSFTPSLDTCGGNVLSHAAPSPFGMGDSACLTPSPSCSTSERFLRTRTLSGSSSSDEENDDQEVSRPGPARPVHHPITIHIKSPFGARALSNPSYVFDAVCDSKEVASDKLLDTVSCVVSGAKHVLNDETNSPNKRIKKARKSSGEADAVVTSSGSPESCSSADNDSSPVGLVDYSDEESDDGDEKHQARSPSFETTINHQMADSPTVDEEADEEVEETDDALKLSPSLAEAV